MEQLFRFPTARAHARDVEAWLDEHSDGLGQIAARWFEVMRAQGDDVREVMHDGYPTACVGDAAFAYVGAFQAHVNVGFFQGSDLPDPHGLLEGTGKRMRHVKLRPGQEIDARALRALIGAAYRDMRRRAVGSAL